MVGSVTGPSDSDKPTPKDELHQEQTGVGKTYTASKAPGFKKWLEIWFPGHVTDEMVNAFEQNMMQMIQNSMRESKAQQAKVEQKIKKRIDES